MSNYARVDYGRIASLIRTLSKLQPDAEVFSLDGKLYNRRGERTLGEDPHGRAQEAREQAREEDEYLRHEERESDPFYDDAPPH